MYVWILLLSYCNIECCWLLSLPHNDAGFMCVHTHGVDCKLLPCQKGAKFLGCLVYKTLLMILKVMKYEYLHLWAEVVTDIYITIVNGPGIFSPICSCKRTLIVYYSYLL